MSPEAIQRTFDATQEAQRELIRVDPHPAVRTDNDEAYRSMRKAAVAVHRILAFPRSRDELQNGDTTGAMK